MMNPSQKILATRVTRLVCADPQFRRMADALVLRVRRAMGVPDQAEAEVEQEFVALRATLDDFYPEFAQIHAGLLSKYLGGAAPVVISSLESEPVQAYLRVAEAIEAEAEATLRSFGKSIGAALSATPQP